MGDGMKASRRGFLSFLAAAPVAAEIKIPEVPPEIPKAPPKAYKVFVGTAVSTSTMSGHFSSLPPRFLHISGISGISLGRYYKERYG